MYGTPQKIYNTGETMKEPENLEQEFDEEFKTKDTKRKRILPGWMLPKVQEDHTKLPAQDAVSEAKEVASRQAEHVCDDPFDEEDDAFLLNITTDELVCGVIKSEESTTTQTINININHTFEKAEEDIWDDAFDEEDDDFLLNMSTNESVCGVIENIESTRMPAINQNINDAFDEKDDKFLLDAVSRHELDSLSAAEVTKLTDGFESADSFARPLTLRAARSNSAAVRAGIFIRATEPPSPPAASAAAAAASAAAPRTPDRAAGFYSSLAERRRAARARLLAGADTRP
jgi:hypothetical protein